jgi:ABC-type antimicrobial peptide transport system permease subunit
MAICCEASALAFAGAGFGVSLALLVTLTQFSMVNAATGAELAFRFQPTLPTLVSSVFAGAIVGLLGGLFPGLQAAYTSPIDALRS